jgi:hypothetical protein
MTESYSDAELSTLDLGAMLAEGITGPDGRMRADLQGIGSAAAAIQLDNQFVTAAQVHEVASGNAEVVHTMVISAIRAALPNLRWVASYATSGGSVDAIDVVAFQPGEDPNAALQAAQAVPGAEVELLVAQPSLTLMAPGGAAPGGPPLPSGVRPL